MNEFRNIERLDVVEEIICLAKDGKSIKLLGIEGLGMTYILKLINSFCSSEGLFSDIGLTFYFSNDYDYPSFKDSLKSQMIDYGIGENVPDTDNLLMLTNKLSRRLIPPNSNRKLIFLFDNFDQHFAEDESTSDTEKTILTKFNLNRIKAINESPNVKTVFVVTYYYPLEHFLRTPWYLNDLHSVSIKLLSSEEQQRFVENRINPDYFPNKQVDINKIKHYGGRYPVILNEALNTNFNNKNDVLKLEEWINRRYLVILKNFEAFGPKSDKPNTFIELLKQVIRGKYKNIGFLPELPAQYCYEERTKSKNTVYVFSDHFKEYIIGLEGIKPEPKKFNDACLTWLHLSDLHYYEVRDGWDAENVLENLITDLKELEEQNDLSPDIIFFTGDLAHGQVKENDGSLEEQYKGVEKFLEKIRKCFLNPVPKENIFLVPGNHDVNRSKVSDAVKNMLRTGITIDRVTRMIKENDQDWKDSFRRLSDYRKFLEKYQYNHLLEDEERLVYAIKRNVRGVHIGIGGFNTCWSCVGDKEKGRLWMGASWQLNTIFSKLKDSDVIIALLHHPPNWFVEKEDSRFEIKLFERFNFCLHGHEHHDWVQQQINNGHTKISAGACYQSSRKENGYNIVKLNFDKQEGEVWLRTYSDDGAGGWIPKIIKNRTTAQGVVQLRNLKYMSKVSTIALDGWKEMNDCRFIDDLIQGHENSMLEFKSSFQWDYKQKKQNKNLGKPILKTISAFSNSEGGQLIIGVNDNKKVLGLDKDYSIFGDVRDKFERILRQMIINTFGEIFAKDNIKIKFISYKSKDICLIKVEKGEEQIFLKTKNKHGCIKKKFYIRSGNTSRELDNEETAAYCLKRFKSYNYESRENERVSDED